MLLEDLDQVEERRLARRKSKDRSLPPELLGTAEDPAVTRRLARYIRPYLPALLVSFVLAMVSALSKIGHLFILERLLEPLFNATKVQPLGPLISRSLTAPPQLDGPGPADDWPGWISGLIGLIDQTVLWTSAFAQTAMLGWERLDAGTRLRSAAIGFVGLVIIHQSIVYSQKLIMRWVALDAVRVIRRDLFARLMALSMRFFHANHSANLIARLTNDLNRLGNLLVDIMTNMVTDVFLVIGMVTYVWLEGGGVVLVALVISAVLFVPVQQLGRRIRNKEVANQMKMSSVFRTLSESLSAQKIVKAFGAEQLEIAKFEKANDSFMTGRYRSAVLQARTQPVVEILGSLGIGLFLYIGGRWVIDGHWDGPSFMTIIIALYSTVASLRRLSDATTKFQAGMSSADRVSTLLHCEAEIQDAPDALELPGFQTSIRFKNVDFAHVAGQPVLRDVDFELHRGETLALVGHTGSGKSTIGDLVARFYDPDAGGVLIDGHDLRALTVGSLRSQLAMVTQETVLFAGTIASNIAYARPDASQEDIERAAKAAFAHEFITRFPDGYDTHVGERGASLSGGERQRIAIARALLADAPILLLDEATSALDTQSEKIVQDAIEHLKAGRTTFVIAHRLSTIRDADQILVLDQGRIAERGNHAALMEQGGIYASMVGMQGDG